MKVYLLAIAICFFTAHSFSQQVTISSFTVKHELPGDVSQWGADAANGMATAGTKPIDDAKMVVKILKGGSTFVCGNTPQTAQTVASFVTKVIRTSDITGALGSCMLQPGDYTICIEFFNVDNVSISRQQCRDFTVAASPVQQQETGKYTGPTLISPANETVFKIEDLRKPLTLRWTPVIPPPKGNDVVYTLRIYEVTKGQQPAQAVKGSPVFEKEAKTTQAIWQVPGEYVRSKDNKTFVWNVQAMNKEGKGYGANNGMSESAMFTMGGGNDMHSIFDSLECTQKNGQYKLTITYENDKSNDYNITSITPIYSLPTATLNIVSISPSLSANVGTNGATRTFTCLITSSVPITELRVRTNYASVTDPSNDSGMFPDTSFVKPCVEGSGCKCGTWGPLVVNEEKKYECGSKIGWHCNKPFNFTTSYQCNPNDKTCQATTSWEIKNGDILVKTGNSTNNVSDAFTPTANGIYTITLYATCNGIKCPLCTYTIVVKDCKPSPDSCKCGNWGLLAVNRGRNYACGSEIGWHCNQLFNFTTTYQCRPNDKTCQAATSWEIKNGDILLKTGGSTNNAADGFTPTANGIYTITLYATCNGIKCPSCTYTIVVKDCNPQCICTGWKPINITFNGTTQTVLCGSTINIPLNVPYSISTDLTCSGKNCEKKVNASINFPNGVSMPASTGSGTGINIPITSTLPGTYSVVLNGSCNNFTSCPPCTIYIHIDSVLAKPCACGAWSQLMVQTSKGIVKYDCNSEIGWNCNKPFKFEASYQCSPNDKTCQATTSWEIKRDGLSIKTGTGTNIITDGFTPTSNGIYTINLDATCNGTKCRACTYTIIVKDCKPSPDSCKCGEWGLLVVNKERNYACGNKIGWHCNQLFNFTTTYQCRTNDKTCQAATSWEIKRDGLSIKTGTGTNIITDGFTPTSNGIYTIILNATCNGIKCPLCTYTIVVKDCIEIKCACGKRESDYIGVAINDQIGHSSVCGGQIATYLNSNIALSFPSYNCIPDSCKAQYTWDLSGGSGFIPVHVAGTGKVFNYTFNIPGSYILSMISYCGGKACDTCKVDINIKGKVETLCKCNEATSFTINYGKGVTGKIKCGETVIAAYQSVLIFSPNNLCLPGKECLKNYTYEVRDLQTNVLVWSQSMIGSNPFTVTMNSHAGYKITITYYCGGKKCSCILYIRTDEGTGCKCGNWNEDKKEFVIHGFSGGSTEEIEYNLKCGKTYSSIIRGTSLDITAAYNCIGKPKCNASYIWSITPPIGPGTLLNVQTVLNYVFSQTGTYTIKLKVYCNGKLCDICESYIKVVDNIGCKCGERQSNYAGVIVNNMLRDSIVCGGILAADLNANIAINFNSYNCKPDSCKSQYTWHLLGGSGFIPVNVIGSGKFFNYLFNIPGLYTLSLISYCGGKACDTCTIRINIKDLSNTTCCGKKWVPQSEIRYWDNTMGYIKKVDCFAKPVTNVAEGSSINYSASSYICGDKCTVKYDWKVIDLGTNSTVNSGTTLTLPFSFPVAAALGSYKFVIYTNCGGKVCDSCGFYFNTIEKKPTCACGKWESGSILAIKLNPGAVSDSTLLECDSVYNVNHVLTSVINIIFPHYICSPVSPSCNATYSWTITGGLIPQSGNTNVITGADFSTPGLFVVSMYAYCGGKICDSCKISINTKETECKCGYWTGPIQISNFAQSQSVKCDGNILLNAGNYSVSIPTYFCNPNNKACFATYSWIITDGNGISSNGTGQVIPYNFITGIYTIIITPTCGTNCPPCKCTVTVKGTSTLCADLIKMDSLKCIGQNAIGGNNYHFLVTINNAGSAFSSSLITSTCGTISLFSSTIPTGLSSLSGTLSTNSTSISSCCIKYSSLRCSDSLCFTLPRCDTPCVPGNTVTQGGYGAPASGNNWGTYLNNHFTTCFPSGLSVGCNYHATFSTAAAVIAALPQGGPAVALTLNYTNPTTAISVFLGQVMTLKMNCTFSSCDPNFSNGGSTLGNMIIASGPFAGWTVYQLLVESEKVLGGCASIYSASALNNACNLVNNTFDNGANTGFLLCGNGNGNPGSTTCKCGKWLDNFLVSYIALGSFSTTPLEGTIKCDSILTLPVGTYSFTSYTVPPYICTPDSCNASYTWRIEKANGTGVQIGTWLENFSYNFNSSGSYIVTITPKCGTDSCPPCKFYVTVKAELSCQCNKWISDNIVMAYTSILPCPPSRVLKCDSTYNLKPTSNVTLTFPAYLCNPESCITNYSWTITGPIPTQSGTSNVIPNANFSVVGSYIISMVPLCGTNKCSCNIYITVSENITTCDASLNTIYNDSPTFISTLSSSHLIDFSTNDNGSPMSTPTDDKGFSCWTWNGISFESFRSSYNNYIYSLPVTIILPPGTYTKAGFDFARYYGSTGTFTVKVYSGTCPVYTYVQNNTASGYLGMNFPGGIDKIEIFTDNPAITPSTYIVPNTPEAVIIDNFRYGN
jgi:hypothetical protein